MNGEVRWAWAEEIVNGNTVRLILEGPSVAWGDEVRVRYTRPANPRPNTGPLRDQSRNEAASFPFRTAVNKMPQPADTTAPRVYSASVDGATLTITFDENLDPAVIPHGGNFALVDAADSSNVFAGVNLENAVISGATVTVTLEEPVPHGADGDADHRRLRDAGPGRQQRGVRPRPGGEERASGAGGESESLLVGDADRARQLKPARSNQLSDRRCSDRLTQDSFTHEGTVASSIWGMRDCQHSGADRMNNAVSQDWELHVDTGSSPSRTR